jgi:hypothetical protein
MNLNGISLVDRHNRPTVIQKTALRVFFINDGEYYDPHTVSGVTVFHKSANLSPNSILEGNLISSTLDADDIVMHFGFYGTGLDDVTQYNPNNSGSLSGIYKLGLGEYVCVLDGTKAVDGHYNLHGSSVVITSPGDSATVGDYIDCWTIRNFDGNPFHTLINEFSLYDDTFFSTTQRVLLEPRNRLLNKHVTLSSVENIKITTEITIQNKDIDESIKNIFKGSAITSATIQIDKINEDSTNLPSHVTVSSFADSEGLVDITSDNTLVFRFDTTQLTTHPNVASFAGVTGPYRITAKYTLLDETIVTPPYFFTIS